jgi:hypothetical protein
VQNPRALFGASGPVRTIRYLTTAWLLGLASCVRTAPQPSAREWISSDSSLYSPTAHLRVGSHVEAGAVTVSVDSGLITIPGEPVADAPVLMSHLYLTAILATLDSTELAVSRSGSGRSPMERRGWRPVVTSDSVLVVAEIHYGETISLAPVQFTLPRVDSIATPLWLIFRLTGNTVLLTAPLVPGSSPQRRDLPGGVQVYVCGSRDLFGRFDIERGAGLKRAYGVAC